MKSKLRAFGTDGKKEFMLLHPNFPSLFTSRVSFMYVEMLRTSSVVQAFLKTFGLKYILDDILGEKMGNSLYEGLVDATTEGELESLQEKYDDSKEGLPAFCNWFVIKKARILKHTMLRPVCEEAGAWGPLLIHSILTLVQELTALSRPRSSTSAVTSLSLLLS